MFPEKEEQVQCMYYGKSSPSRAHLKILLITPENDPSWWPRPSTIKTWQHPHFTVLQPVFTMGQPFVVLRYSPVVICIT